MERLLANNGKMMQNATNDCVRATTIVGVAIECLVSVCSSTRRMARWDQSWSQLG